MEQHPEPRLGPLRFDASFESGNLAEARLISEMPCVPAACRCRCRATSSPPAFGRLEYDLHIRPDTLNTRHRVWFYFAVQGAPSGQKVIFNIIGYSKTKSLYRDGMAPVVSTSARPHWERMPEGSVYFYRSPRHGRQYVLSFPFCFERADEVYYFAYCACRRLPKQRAPAACTHARRADRAQASRTRTRTCSAFSTRSTSASCRATAVSASGARCRTEGWTCSRSRRRPTSRSTSARSASARRGGRCRPSSGAT